jgi:hydroxymethylpyrimidine kinase/phosphomethylpyrimidine kinase
MRVRQENRRQTQVRGLERGVARVVAIGGFDPTGGAGLVRDFITGVALGAEMRLVPAALTEQSSAGVTAIEPRAPAELEAALATALAIFAGVDDAANVAVKVGMLPGRDAVDAVLRGLGRFAGPVVVDPVLASSSGGRLFRGEISHLLPLVRRASLLTPNALELAALTGAGIADLAGAVTAGRGLLAAGARAILVKGGHLEGEEATDALLTRAESSEGDAGAVEYFRGARLGGGEIRGTGCALATAVAVGLARGLALAEAVARAKDWLRGAMESAFPVGPDRHLGPG